MEQTCIIFQMQNIIFNFFELKCDLDLSKMIFSIFNFNVLLVCSYIYSSKRSFLWQSVSLKASARHTCVIKTLWNVRMRHPRELRRRVSVNSEGPVVHWTPWIGLCRAIIGKQLRITHTSILASPKHITLLFCYFFLFLNKAWGL